MGLSQLPNPYVCEVESVDEEGRPEVWTIQFGRLLTKDLDLLEKVADESIPAGQKVVLVNRMMGQLVKSVKLNGEDRSVDELPIEVGVDAFDKHPLFRG